MLSIRAQAWQRRRCILSNASLLRARRKAFQFESLPLSLKAGEIQALTLVVFSKVAPQNIMYDRRVVRGNTFAALVIPVSK